MHDPFSDTNYADEFPQRGDIIYLNHAAVAPWPKRTAHAVKTFAEENVRQGALAYPDWMEVESTLRKRLQTLLNAPSSEDIALLKSTSEALSTVAYGLQWRAGDNIVIAKQEFPSNRIVWESLSRFGVQVRLVDLEAVDPPEEALFSACNERTRLISVSSVQYATGLRMDLNALGHFCQAQEILLCIDAIQSLGALAFDVQSIGADFVMADGHKWMLGPEGLAVLYCKPEHRDKLALHQYGWHMVEEHFNFDRLDWQEATSARRFECGSPNNLGAHALSASLSLLLEINISAIERMVLDNTAYLAAQFDKLEDVTLTSPRLKARQSGIVSFRYRDTDSAALYRHLQSRGVICALRGGTIRLSPHFYTPREALEHVLEMVAAFQQPT